MLCKYNTHSLNPIDMLGNSILRAYRYVISALTVIFGSIFLYLYIQFSALSNMDFTPPPISIDTAVAKTQTWPSLIHSVGTIRAASGVNLSTESDGEIISINVTPGQFVQAGTIIVELNNREEKARKEKLQASLELKQLLFERDSRLIKQKSIPKSRYDESLASLREVKAELSEINAVLDTKAVIAPFNGTVGVIRVDIGDYVETDTEVTSLQNLDQLELDFSLPAKHAPKLKKGLNITLTSDAFDERVFSAILRDIDSRIDPSTRNILLRGELISGQGLLPGMFVRLSIDLGQPRDLVTVPETAVGYSLQGDTVYIIRKENDQSLAEPTIVQVGESRDGYTSILTGLSEGLRVATAGQNKLFQGAAVKYIQDTN